MEHVRLGNTGLKVSRLCMGTMTFGLQSYEPTAISILDRALDAGVSFLDTSDIYPIASTLETVGRTEEIIGRWLRGRRHHVILATKCVGRTGPEPWSQGSSRKHVLDAIDASLRRLGTDYVDLYQLHLDDRNTPLDETVDALDAVVQSGRARYVGVSNFAAYRVALAVGRAASRTRTPIACVQPRYNLLSREIERDLIPLVEEVGLGMITYNPLAGGLLTGKHRVGQPTPDTRFTLAAGAGDRYQKRYWRDDQFELVDKLRSVAMEAGRSLTTMAVAWVLANPLVTSAIIGASRLDQLADNLAAVEHPLDPDLKRTLDELTTESLKR